jgi:WD40 repeat protein
MGPGPASPSAYARRAHPIADIGCVGRFSPDSRQIVAALPGGGLRVWDLTHAVSGKSKSYDVSSTFGNEPVKAPTTATEMAFSQDGRFLATNNDDELRLWRLSADASGPVLRYPCHRTTLVRAVSVHDATDPGWHDEPMVQAQFSPDGRTLATAWRSKHASRFRLLDARTGREEADLPGTPCLIPRDEQGNGGPEDCAAPQGTPWPSVLTANCSRPRTDS